VSERFGIGAVVERVLGDRDFWVSAVPFAHHSGPWKAYLAPGFEHSSLGREPLLRIGVEYGFEAGHWEVAPQFDVDFVDGEHVFVLGVTILHGF
jgi:hypothetical protein